MIAKESPLKGITHGQASTIAIRELPGVPVFDLRVAPGSSSQAAVVEVLELSLPDRTGGSSGSGDAHALALGPDWWLIVGFPGASEKLDSLRYNEKYHFSSVDVSGQRTIIELEGPNVREVLAHVWEQDLREKNFPMGSVSQGLMVKAPVILWHIAPFHYRVFVRSSFAIHLWQALVDAAEEYV